MPFYIWYPFVESQSIVAIVYFRVDDGFSLCQFHFSLAFPWPMMSIPLLVIYFACSLMLLLLYSVFTLQFQIFFALRLVSSFFHQF